jgi:hypothetical protein
VIVRLAFEASGPHLNSNEMTLKSGKDPHFNKSSKPIQIDARQEEIEAIFQIQS